MINNYVCQLLVFKVSFTSTVSFQSHKTWGGDVIGRWVSSQTHRLGEEIKNKHLHLPLVTYSGFPDGSVIKNLPAMWETWVWYLGWEEPLEKGAGYPLQYSCLENPMVRGAWLSIVHGATKSLTQLSKQASFPSCILAPSDLGVSSSSSRLPTCLSIRSHPESHYFAFLGTHSRFPHFLPIPSASKWVIFLPLVWS